MKRPNMTGCKSGPSRSNKIFLAKRKDGTNMTRSRILLEDLVELINEHGGMDSFSQAMSLLMDNAMTLERAEVLEAEPYERTETRRGYANGFKSKTSPSDKPPPGSRGVGWFCGNCDCRISVLSPPFCCCRSCSKLSQYCLEHAFEKYDSDSESSI